MSDASKPKQDRALDRHSGTGRPIKGENVREGSGKGNWGSNQEVIDQGIASVEEEKSGGKQPKRKKNDEPETLGELNEAAEVANPKVFDEFLKDSGRSLASPYNNKEVKSGYSCKQMRLKKSEKQTDKLFNAVQKKKPKKKQKKKQKTVLGNLSFTFASEEQAAQEGGRGRGGRGRGRGGYQGYDNRGGRGFGSRGRGMGFGRGRAQGFPRGPVDEQGVPQAQGPSDESFNYDASNANARNFVNADQEVPVNAMPQPIQEQQA